MPAFSQEELDELLGVGYATRVLETPVPRPRLTRSVPASKTNVRTANSSDLGEGARISLKPSPKASHTSRVLAFNRGRPSLQAAPSSSIAVVIQTPPTSTPDNQLLALSFDEPIPKNKWTKQQRLTLAFMRRTFHNNLHEQLQIFNTMFADGEFFGVNPFLQRRRE